MHFGPSGSRLRSTRSSPSLCMAIESVHDLNRTHELPSKVTFRLEDKTS
jgi:hypothetical protein